MKHYALIACISQKQDRPAKARELYTNPLFRYSLKYAEQLSPSGIYILSAKHGLIHEENII